MKKLLFFFTFILSSGLVLSGETTITNSGFIFTPDSISIRINDTVDFQIDGMLNVVEVSQAKWNINGNTSGVGISNIETSNTKVSIHPNPTEGKFDLRYQESVTNGIPTGELRLDIYNFLGEKIFSQTNPQQQPSYELDLTSFPDGVYFLSIVSSIKTSTIRIMKR